MERRINFVEILTILTILSIMFFLRCKVVVAEAGQGWGIRHNHPHHHNNWKGHQGQGHHLQHFRPHYGGFGGSSGQKVGIGHSAMNSPTKILLQRVPIANDNHPHFSVPIYGGYHGGYPSTHSYLQGVRVIIPQRQQIFPPPKETKNPQESNPLENINDSTHSDPSEEPGLIVVEAGPIFPPPEVPEESLPSHPENPSKDIEIDPKAPQEVPQLPEKVSEQSPNSPQDELVESDYDFSKLVDIRGNF